MARLKYMFPLICQLLNYLCKKKKNRDSSLVGLPLVSTGTPERVRHVYLYRWRQNVVLFRIGNVPIVEKILRNKEND